MFRLPNTPTPGAKNSELADYMELQCWIQSRVSQQEVLSLLSRAAENVDIGGETYTGCEDEDDEQESQLDDVLSEIDYRQKSCGGGYPFKLERGGILLPDPTAIGATQGIAYLFCLAATRLNMSSDRMQNKIDGTAEMEYLSAAALEHYLGGKQSRSMVFGTASANGFEDSVRALCKDLNEPTTYNPSIHAPTYVKDDKLDAVAWIPHANNSPGQLILFAQAKTGTSWRSLGNRLKPEAFQKKWLNNSFLVDPITAFCVAEALSASRLVEIHYDYGLFFDRCRLVSCASKLDSARKTRMAKWVAGAKKRINKQLNS